MCLVEANSLGVPVIAADVGWVRDLGADWIFTPGNCQMLADILDGRMQVRLNRRRGVQHISWENYATRVCAVVEELKHATKSR